MDRKYKQHGYQDAGGAGPAKPQAKPDRDGPKSPKMMEFTGAVRCATCGASVSVDLGSVQVGEQCAKCGSDLRTCRNCVNFDPAARWECRAPVTVRVANKSARTDCDKFSPRRVVEKRTGETRGGSTPDDPRAAFDRLFKR